MKKIITIGMILFISFLIVDNRYTNMYVANVTKDKGILPVAKNSELMEEIVEKAKAYEIAPIDAELNSIWKAIPGYNGQTVDIQASYAKMKKAGTFSEDKLVLKETKPKKHLEDLPPAPIYKGNPEKPMVSFIINVAWGNEYLSDMLATLKKHQVKATFFLEGRWVRENPELAKMIVDAGHEVGNHSFSHPNMKTLSSEKIREELNQTNKVIEATTKKSVRWFAPPSGSYRDETVQIADELGLGTIMWTLDTIDWQKPSPNTIINRIIPKLHNGAIILMHPTDPTSKALDQLIQETKKKNYMISTISDLMSEERINK